MRGTHTWVKIPQRILKQGVLRTTTGICDYEMNTWFNRTFLKQITIKCRRKTLRHWV